MKYIFVAGAPGSKWSSVVKNIYYSPDIDRSDYSDTRTYYHDASGKMELMHLGAYYDPGMEFGRMFHTLSMIDKETLEKDFDEPFSGQGVRIIKSHVFANHVDHLKALWPECPVVLVHRDDDACLGWWVKCGHFDITYPLYHEYYRDLKTMAGTIRDQNAGIVTAQRRYPGRHPLTNHELARMLSIAMPPEEYTQDYGQSNVRVTVI
jgi:hypothetical protein